MKTLFMISLFLFSAGLIAQPAIKYVVSFPNIIHHEAEVQIEFSGLPAKALELRMSRSSPGRYALHEFAKNVYNVRVSDRAGNRLDFTRPNPHQWNVAHHDGVVKIHYTIFGDLTDGTYLALDNTHAHLNMPATFMWAKGLENNPIKIEFILPKEKWKIATQLIPANAPNIFTAPNLDYFMDSPVEISDFQMASWREKSNQKDYSIRLALHHQGNIQELEAYRKMARAVIKEQIHIFDELPQFENASYTFIADYLPYVYGDGMEHRNSSVLTEKATLKEDAVDLFGTLAHEFIHSWNVERIRPKSLEPFSLERANMSGELWFAEGFTNYYGPLTITRAGGYSLDKYAKRISRSLNFVINAPGSRVKSAEDMSRYAPFVDAGKSIDPKNLENIYVSYYSFGEVIALGLDLTLRTQFAGITLDDFMKALWQKYGKSETPYTNIDLENTLAEVTKNTDFARSFFDKFVYGNELQNYAHLLQFAGMSLKREEQGGAWLGFSALKVKNRKLVVAETTRRGTPLYRAGLDKGDTLLTFDGDSLKTEAALEKWLKLKKPGEAIDINFNSRDGQKTTKLVLQENPQLIVTPFEHDSLEITPNIVAFRKSWLGVGKNRNDSTLVRYCPLCKRAFPFRFEFCRYDGEALKITLEPNKN